MPDGTESNLPAVAVRAVLDTQFRQALIDNMDTTLAIAQLPLTADEEAALQGMNLAEWQDLSLHAVQQRIGAAEGAGLGISLSIKQITIR